MGTRKPQPPSPYAGNLPIRPEMIAIFLSEAIRWTARRPRYRILALALLADGTIQLSELSRCRAGEPCNASVSPRPPSMR